MNEEPAPSHFDEDALAAAYERGKAAENGGDAAGAIAAFRQCLTIDPDDHCGVAMKLARYGQTSPDQAPPAYVTALFDQEAETFDETLVERLGYDVPAMMRRLAAPHAPFARLLDLGCGTGLVGAAFADIAETVVGVDLSEGMLTLADDRGVYADLYVGDVVRFAAEWDEAPFDALAAADLLPYLGDLEPFAHAAGHALGPGGRLFASTERGGAEWAVTATQRFAHSTPYVTSVLRSVGFAAFDVEDIVVRYEEGVPVKGDLIAAKKV